MDTLVQQLVDTVHIQKPPFQVGTAPHTPEEELRHLPSIIRALTAKASIHVLSPNSQPFCEPQHELYRPGPW